VDVKPGKRLEQVMPELVLALALARVYFLPSTWGLRGMPMEDSELPEEPVGIPRKVRQQAQHLEV
jgi:hypothetical protein